MTVVVAHQPQYLPYLGYLYKASLADDFVLLDQVQYSRNKVQNRNVIRGQQRPVVLTVPVLLKGNFGASIRDVRIDNNQPWARKHWKSIRQTYGRYPHFEVYAEALERTYEHEWERLAELNLHLLGLLFEWFGIGARIRLGFELQPEGKKSDMLVDLCRDLGADTYVSGLGAADYLEPESFTAAGISLRWAHFEHPVYAQHEEPFVPELCALDALFNLGPAASSVLEDARRISRVTESP